MEEQNKMPNKKDATKKRDAKRISIREGILAKLLEKQPALFKKDDPKPLAGGIKDDVIKMLPDAERTQINRFFVWWCNRRDYLKAVIADGSVRYGLSGEVVSAVTEEQRAHSVHVLNARNAKSKEAKKS